MRTYDIILISALVTAIVVLWIVSVKGDTSDLKKAEKNRFSSIIANGIAGGTVGAAVMHGIEHNRYWVPLAMFVVLVLNNVLIRKRMFSKSGYNQLNK